MGTPKRKIWQQNTAPGCFVHALTSFLRKGGLYDHMVCLSTSVPHTNPFPAISEPASNYTFHVTTPLKERQRWELNWPVMGETTSKLETCHVLRTRTTQLNFLLDVPHQSKEIQSQDTSLLKILFPYLTAGWVGPSLWQEFCSKEMLYWLFC